MFVADPFNNKIHRITATGAVTTFAVSGDCGGEDNFATSAAICVPIGIAVDSAQNKYVSDGGINKIWKIIPSTP